jgi:hypothetical protein
VVDEPVDEGDDAGGAREDGVPVVDASVGGDDDGFLFVSSGDDLKQEVRGPLVVGEIADFIDTQDLGLA